MNWLRHIFLLFLFAGFTVPGLSQDKGNQLYLADHYLQKEEFEKALSIYEDLYDNNPTSDHIYSNFLKTLLALEQYKDARQLAEDQIDLSPENLTYRVDLGYVYEKAGNDEKARQQYERAIDNLSEDQAQVKRLATAFELRQKLDYALKTYQKGHELFEDQAPFHFELGKLYAATGATKKMINTYLEVLEYHPKKRQKVQNSLQDHLTQQKEFKQLQKAAYKKIQQHPDQTAYNEVLIWLFTQQKKFGEAWKQVKAVARRKPNGLQRVMKFARVARTTGAYDAAIKAYEYVIERGGQAQKLKARMRLLDTQKEKITTTTHYTQEDLLQLRKEYESFFNDYGRNYNTAKTMKELARIEAFYLENTDKAVSILEEIKNMPKANESLKAECKLILGDIHLLTGKTWEASLLYSQVEKAFKNDRLGHRAKFKNAKLYYFIGDFDWAQTQLDVLKGSTSKLISNDALRLSMLISDNIALDSIRVPLKMYAQAELDLFQHNHKEANAQLDTILTRYPNHSLTDEVYFLKAKINIKQQDYEKAAAMYQEALDAKPTDILADDALFKLASLYHHKLNQPEKAKKHYETIILDYSDSIYAVEARKRFRELRGDRVN